MNETEPQPAEQKSGIDHFNPVIVTAHNTVGMVFMGLVALTLLAALLRSQRRYQQLLESLQIEIERAQDCC